MARPTATSESFSQPPISSYSISLAYIRNYDIFATSVSRLQRTSIPNIHFHLALAPRNPSSRLRFHKYSKSALLFC